MTPIVIIEQYRYVAPFRGKEGTLWRWHLDWPDGVTSSKSLGFENPGDARLNALRETGLTDFVERCL